MIISLSFKRIKTTTIPVTCSTTAGLTSLSDIFAYDDQWFIPYLPLVVRAVLRLFDRQLANAMAVRDRWRKWREVSGKEITLVSTSAELWSRTVAPRLVCVCCVFRSFFLFLTFSFILNQALQLLFPHYLDWCLSLVFSLGVFFLFFVFFFFFCVHIQIHKKPLKKVQIHMIYNYTPKKCNNTKYAPCKAGLDAQNWQSCAWAMRRGCVALVGSRRRRNALFTACFTFRWVS
jgi:hypothetical protein